MALLPDDCEIIAVGAPWTILASLFHEIMLAAETLDLDAWQKLYWGVSNQVLVTRATGLIVDDHDSVRRARSSRFSRWLERPLPMRKFLRP